MRIQTLGGLHNDRAGRPQPLIDQVRMYRADTENDWHSRLVLAYGLVSDDNIFIAVAHSLFSVGADTVQSQL